MQMHLKAHQVFVSVACALAAIAGLTAPTPFAAAQAGPSDEQAIASYVETQVRNAHYPGLAVGAVRTDGSLYTHGFGVSDPSGESVTAHTPFIIGSLSKSFTALAIMQLVEQGKVDLDAPVKRYLPEFGTASADASSAITVRHLLNQTSGIPKSAVKELQMGTGGETIEDAVQRLDRVTLTAPVGTTYQYSNMNYVTLGLIVQVVSRQPYGAYIEQHIFGPLGMRDSFASPPLTHEPRLATPYRWIFGVPLPAVLPFNESLLPAGSLISSADDITRYLSAQLDGGTYAGTAVLSPQGLDELHRPAAVMPGTDQHYAMGWVDSPVDGEATLWHSGVTIFGYESYMLLLPARHIGVVVLANAYALGADDFADPLGTIAHGIAGIEEGQSSAPADVALPMAFVISDALMALMLLLVVGSLVRLIRGGHRPLHGRWSVVARVILPMLWELLLPLGLLTLLILPLLGPLPLMLMAAPDLTWWVLALSSVLLVTAAMRIRFCVIGARQRTDSVSSSVSVVSTARERSRA